MTSPGPRRSRPFTRLSLEALEVRSVPAAAWAVGAAPGSPGTAALIDGSTGQPRFTVAPFGDGFTGGVSAAAGDVTGDAVPDLVAAGGSRVAVFDGATGKPVSGFAAFDSPGGLNVAAGDVNGDGIAEVVVGAKAGGGPRVSVFDGRSGAELRTFFAFEPGFVGGVNVAAADVNADGRADIVLGAGGGGGPRVRAVSGATGVELGNRFAYAADFRGGVFVAAGDVDRDGTADVITGAGPGGGPHVRCFRGSDGSELTGFFAADPALRSGVEVGCAESGADRQILAAVPGGEVRAFAADSGGAVGRPTASGLAPVSAANPAVVWNEVALRAIAASGTAPPVAARNLAILHAAVFDAVNTVAGRYSPYHFHGTALEGTSAEAAATAAAHRALTRLYPALSARFDGVRAGQLGVIADGVGKDTGVALGEAVADDILALRAGDIPAATPFTPGSAPGEWVPTPPGFTPFALPQWGSVRPFAIGSVEPFRPAGPPALTDADYTASWDEVRRLGRSDSAERTAAQTEIALFWAAGGGTVTPPGMSLRIAGDEARGTGLDLTDSARALALVSFAVADAGVVAWDAKLRFANWRPVTAIRQADADGNPATAADPTWSPLLVTPSFPDYISGHSTFSSAAAAALEGVFGPDVRFRTYSESLPDVSRSFAGFAAAAAEAGKSRIYGGIHLEFANRDGLAAGRSVGQFVVGNLLQPA